MIERRRLLQILSAAALTSACSPDVTSSKKLKVVVVGAGIVGASIAYHLSLKGAKVTVIDRVGLATQTTRGTFAWINASWAKQPKSYHALNQDGVSNWRQLQKDLGIPIKWGGSIEWFESAERQERLRAQIDEQRAWGEPAEMLSVEALREMEPNVDFTDVSMAALSGNDAALDPELATQILLDAAVKNGVEVKYPCELLRITSSSEGVSAVQTSAGDISADKVVLATGAAPDMASRFAKIDLPQRSTPGVIAITKPMPPLINRLIIAPGVHMHQRLDGRFVLGEQEGAPDTEAHAMRLAERPTVFPNDAFATQHFDRINAVAMQFVPEMENAEAEEVHIGWRSLPIDGHPVLGFSPQAQDVYLAVMHSGVSLAPIVGQLAAQEIVSGAQVGMLEAYRPSRDFETVRRY